MKRSVVLGLAAALALPMVAAAQSPSPEPSVEMHLCVTADVGLGVLLAPIPLMQAIRDGRVFITDVAECPSVGASPSPEPAASAFPAPIATTSPPTVFATPKPTRKPKPTEAAHAALSKRQWQRLVRSPDDHVGDRIRVWGCVSQFDQNTGPDTFRAETYYKKLGRYDWFGDTTNAILSGDASDLEDLSQDDVFSAQVTVVGSYEYDTTIGGSASAVLFLIDTIRRRGSCD